MIQGQKLKLTIYEYAFLAIFWNTKATQLLSSAYFVSLAVLAFDGHHRTAVGIWPNRVNLINKQRLLVAPRPTGFRV